MTIRAGFEQVDRRFERMAETLGAGPLRVFATITLPLARRSVLAARAAGLRPRARRVRRDHRRRRRHSRADADAGRGHLQPHRGRPRGRRHRADAGLDRHRLRGAGRPPTPRCGGAGRDRPRLRSARRPGRVHAATCATTPRCRCWDWPGRRAPARPRCSKRWPGCARPRGVIRVGGRTLLDTAAGIDVPPRLRRVGYVPQDALLFPHLTVRRQPRVRRQARAPASTRWPRCWRWRTCSTGRPPVSRAANASAWRSAGPWPPSPICSCSTSRSARSTRRAAIASCPYVLRTRQALGVPMIWVTHDVQELTHAADRAIVVDRGRVIHAGSVAGAVSVLRARPSA